MSTNPALEQLAFLASFSNFRSCAFLPHNITRIFRYYRYFVPYARKCIDQASGSWTTGCAGDLRTRTRRVSRPVAFIIARSQGLYCLSTLSATVSVLESLASVGLLLQIWAVPNLNLEVSP